MKKRVLIFPAGSEIGLEINRSLSYRKDFEPVGGSSVDDFSRFAYEAFIPGLPFVGDEDFIQRIAEAVKQYKIDYIFPAHDDVVVELSKNQSKIDAEVVTSNADTCKICRSKKMTYKALKDVVPTPELFEDIEKIKQFPVFVKPDAGQGSKGAQRVESMYELKAMLAKNKDLIVLENLPGAEYTVDCFTDSEGKLCFSQARERVRTMNGISIESRPVNSEACRDMALSINKKMKFRGVWFFQVKEKSDGELVLLEVAPRVAGTMALCRMQGVNLPLLSLYDREGIPTNIFKNKFDIEISRSLTASYKIGVDYQKAYIDFDDTLIVDGKVNDKLMAFLYRCLDRKKEIYLITKHAKDIRKTLSEYKISPDIFHEIIHITHEHEKSDYIEGQAIFVDDSFSERRKIFESHGIPVFDVSEAVELL